MKNVGRSNEIDNILSNGISLESLGVKNWAFSQKESLLILDKFVELQIPVLGGDVCDLVNEAIRFNYDNWYCNKLSNEPHLDFVKRSINKAREYIEQYSVKKSDKIFFVFVLDL